MSTLDTATWGGQFAPGPVRLWEKVEKTSTCWLWTGSVNSSRYGTIRVDGKSWRVHRYAWVLLRGPIPDGLVVDHLCRVRRCVNPEHMELVVGEVNVLRGIGITAVNGRKTHCKRGHEFTTENTRIDRRGHRVCRTCHRLHARKGGIR